jgi:Lon protease-like protein
VSDGATPAAMFPLGTVLFPSVYLPLHVFEPRYRELVRVCLDGDGSFGVTLIERGSEVGGGDVRTGVGTRAQIVEAREMPDGRWALGAVGAERLRVLHWLDDDPYPRAEIELWPDDPSGLEPAEEAELAEVVVARLRRVLARHAELGHRTAPATIELAEDPGLASFQASAVAPLGPADHQSLLASASVFTRLTLLDQLLTDREAPDDPGGDTPDT